MTERKTLRDIKEQEWWPQPETPGRVPLIQVWPEPKFKRPYVARMCVGTGMSNEELKQKQSELCRRLDLEPIGNDGLYYYFLRKDRPCVDPTIY